MLYSRGSPYSRTHVEYSEYEEEFWDISWSDMGLGDIRAAVDLIYHETNKKVSLSGYSMGTTQIYIALSEDYDYYRNKEDKVAVMAPCRIPDVSLFAAFNFASVGVF